ncbi:MAG: hypothetical protein HON53_11200 [Planctomycetaceae bacterium]|jgi:internalin A|nr:hypothetical protein [Planctomycetaceae bacterium]MBT6157012.1 hypothetical protein [Planctomycetaceae bacterium]MBT6484422.1 hypothetical protein [Planctomycetaceae bacterium]MBT6494663.1 hypothetical protein [Planctomycetaceae bacterium]
MPTIAARLLMPFKGTRCAILLLVCLTVLASGCGGEDDGASNSAGTDSAQTETFKGGDPPLPVAESSGENQLTPRMLHEWLKEKNPEYENNAQFGPQDGEIIAVSLRDTGVTDLSPLAGMKLQSLDLFQTKVSDLSPLEGMPLVELMADETAVSDISPLAGMPLKTLWLNATAVEDISPLKGMPIEKLNLFGTKVVDISVIATLPLNTLWLRDVPVKDFRPLKGLYLDSLDVQGTAFGDDDLALLKAMPVLRLNIADTQVTDLTSLQNLKLTRLIFTPDRIKSGLDVVRSMNSLRELDVTFREPKRLAPPEFWSQHAAGAFNKPSE